jgi:hypothetical protein
VRRRQRDRGTERQRDRETEGLRDREMVRRREGETGRQRELKTPRLLVSPSLCLSVSLFLLLPFYLLICTSWFTPLIAKAQADEITGRVVTEDGVGLPNAMVTVQAVTAEGFGANGVHISALTDEGGYFKFTESEPSLYYEISVYQVEGNAVKPVPVNGRRDLVYTHIGSNLTITLIKGGSITGRITNAKGEPVIGAYVWAEMTRDARGKPVRGAIPGRRRFTDDRGVYRLYGLAPGSYVVLTSSDIAGHFASDYSVPTYHPSSTRETAAEVAVTSGAETSGIDIRYHEDRGHVISGAVNGKDAYVLLVSTGTGAGLNYIYPNNYSVKFSFHGLPPMWKYVNWSGQFEFRGLPDGEYVVAVTKGGYDTSVASTPRRISLRGGDVTGVELELLPLGSISGRAVIETLPGGCDGADKITPDRLSITAIRDDLPKDDPAFSNLRGPVIPRSYLGEKTDFTAGHLYPGHYRIVARFPDENGYVKAITLSATVPAPGGAPAAVGNVSRDGVSLKQGEKLDGVIVTVGEGAASVRGKAIAKNTGARRPERLLAHLVPAEPNATDDVLRYAETPVYDDGAFVFKNVAPGKYWLMARAAPNEDSNGKPSGPLAWDANERAKLRREAAAAKNEIELKPCQRIKEHVLRWQP